MRRRKRKYSGSAHDESVVAIDVHIILACKLSEITQRIRWIHASELVTFKGNANSPNGAIKMGKDYSFSSFAVLHQNLLYRWSIGKEKNPCVTYNHRSVMCWMCVCVCMCVSVCVCCVYVCVCVCVCHHLVW